MSNLINATVYQIDGNPQKVATVVAFDTNKIRLQETTLSTIPQVVSFIEVQGEKLNAPVVKYFVSESVATLVAAANIGGVTLLQATIVAINENPFKLAIQMAFPANKVTVWEFINGTIQSFLQFNEDKFYAIESKSDLVSTANSSSYKVFTALLTQSGGSVYGPTVGDETLNKGVTYTIDNLEPGDNLIPYGAPNNEVGTSFVCNQEISNWGNPLSQLSFNSGAPVVTILENTIGNIWFTYNNNGYYSIRSNESEPLFTYNKTTLFNQTKPSDDFTVSMLMFYVEEFQININTYSDNMLSDGLLYIPTTIEIRVYN